MASAQGVTISAANPGTNDPINFYVHFDGTPYPDFVEGDDFYVVIADLNGARCAMGYGGGDGEDVWVTANSFYGSGTLTDGVYQVFAGDATYAGNDTLAFYFSVCTAPPQFNTLSASNIVASINAQSLVANFPDSGLQDALDFNDGIDFNISVIGAGTSGFWIEGQFVNVLPNDYGLQNYDVASVDYSLDGQDYTSTGASFDGVNAYAIDLDVTGLDDGPHVVYIRGTDLAGDTVVTSYWFAIDNTPPIVTWFDSQGNIIYDGDSIPDANLGVTAGVWEPVGLSSGGGFAPGVFCYQSATSCYFIYSAGLSPNEYVTLTMSVTSLGGLTTADSITLNFAMAPIPIGMSPSDGQWVQTSWPSINAEFIIPSGGELREPTATIDGNWVSSDGGGNSVSVDLAAPLSEGMHTVSISVECYFSAWDVYSDWTTCSWSFSVDTVPPTLTSFSLNGGYLDAVPADATSGVSFISLDIGGCNGHFQPYALSGDSIHFDTSTMSPGYYAIKGTIIDVAGNSYRFVSGLTIPEEGDDDGGLDDVAADTSVDIKIWRTIESGDENVSVPHQPVPNEDVWIGECVDVEAVFADPLVEEQNPGSGFQWHVPSDVIAGYTWTTSLGEVQRIGNGANEDHLDRARVTLFWWRKPTPNPATVYCDIQFPNVINGALSQRVTATFKVHSPDCDMTAALAIAPTNKLNTCNFPDPDPDDPNGHGLTTVLLEPGNLNVEYETDEARAQKPNLVLGILGGTLTPMPDITLNPNGTSMLPGNKRFDWGNTTGINFGTTLSNVGSGSDAYFFMQVVNQVYESRHGLRTAANGQTQEEIIRMSLNTEPEWSTNPNVPGAAYDLNFLFDGERSVSHDGSPFLDMYKPNFPSYYGLAHAFNPNLSTVDGPSEVLNSTRWSEYEKGIGFAMYVMYLPDTVDSRSIAVPLKICKWGIWSEATQDGCSSDNSSGNGRWVKALESTFPYLHDPAVPVSIPEWLGNTAAVHWNGETLTNHSFDIDW